MQKIIPLIYEVRLWKKCLSEEKLKRYSNPEYFKNRLEEEFKLGEHLADTSKIFVKKYSLKDVSLEEEIEVDSFNGKDFIFAKFKYWDKVAKNDNGKIVHDWQIIQEMRSEWSLLTDFYFWMEFNATQDSKFLFIKWTITTVQKSNEQMRAQIQKLLSNDLYRQDNYEFMPEHKVDFKFEEQEISRISEKIKWLELVTEMRRESELEQAQKGNKKKAIPIKISVWGWPQDKICKELKELIEKIPWIKWIKKRAIVKQWKSVIRSNYSSDWLKLSLKDSFLYSDESIDYEKFKQETYKHIFPGMDFDD